MSQRGSFVTEYIYCDACFAAAKTVLINNDKYLCSCAVPHWNEMPGDELPIIAGKIGHTWSESFFIEEEIGPALSKVICHPMRIAVLAEGSEPAVTIVVNPASN